MAEVNMDNITREVLEPVWNRRDIPIRRIAETLGVARTTVAYRAKKLGLPPRKRGVMQETRGSDEIFRQMWEAGVSITDMARYLGYANRASVCNRRRRLGLPVRGAGFNPSMTAADFHTALLTDRQANSCAKEDQT